MGPKSSVPSESLLALPATPDPEMPGYDPYPIYEE